uniref:Uncharacterized protein n=1 Tax=Globodera rostochiensis TaxID=31243 RepID=A0A914HTR2_GLORO
MFSLPPFATFLLLVAPFSHATEGGDDTVCCHDCYVAFRDCFRECLSNEPENMICVPNCKNELGNCSTEKCGRLCPFPKNPEFYPPRKYHSYGFP